MNLNNVSDKKKHGILVLDYGSQYTLLIVRVLRELGVYSEIIDGTSSSPPLHFQYDGIILSGGPDSVGESGARRLPGWVFDNRRPILGICYGLQLLIQEFGGKIRSGKAREYGCSSLTLTAEENASAAKVFWGLPLRQTVWMSHGDDIESLPDDFKAIGFTDDGIIGAVVHKEHPIIGLQFHPEVHHTECGREIIRKFADDLCRAKFDWSPGNMVQTISESITRIVQNGRVLVGVSGGVDSTVTAALLAKTLKPEQVTAALIDHGLMRKNEVDWVMSNLKFAGIKNLFLINAEENFLGKLEKVFDPEQKRKVIGRIFIEEFEKFAKKSSGITHLAQGTLYPDVIESAGHGAKAKVIKSHHNVGGLPEKLGLKLVEPFRFLFKDEVRQIGRELGLSPALINRHPFPGPGLAVRILGEVTREKIRILQEADDIFISALKKEDLYDSVWQAFVVLLPVKSVGVMGDNRTYQYTAALRAVHAVDGMTAKVGNLPIEFLTRVADSIVRQVDGINRIVYDLSSKPPATIEWE